VATCLAVGGVRQYGQALIVRISINIKFGLLVAATLGLPASAGCAARLPEPNAADAARAEQRWPGTTVSDLHRGRERYQQSCVAYHRIIDPHQFQAGRWPGFVSEMSRPRHLAQRDLIDLTRYLVVAAESPAAL
jgi:hypothetical protein